LSFAVIQEFEMLMQECIKEVINIHKCKFFFFLILCELAGRGIARASRGPMRAEPARACGLTILACPAFFLRACGPGSRARP